MKPVITNVIAGLLGMALGWVVVGDPLSAMFAPSQVTWNATSCPPGVYNITSTARNLSSGESKVTSSANVTLPRETVVQMFPDLPAGTYSVTAVALRTDGETFASATQTLAGLGGPAGSPGPSGVNGTGPSSRIRPPATQPVSRARPRSPVGSTPVPGLPRVDVPSAATQGATAAKGAPSPLFRITVDADGNLVSTDANWQRVVHADLDGDGRFDVVTIELVTGDVWIIHLKR
jgi:hypothetical protein